MDRKTVLEQVRDGILTPEEADRILEQGGFAEKGFAEMGFARLDTDREDRTGFPEVIFC